MIGGHLQAGSELAGYRIESLVGEGGMGAVYLATQLRLDRRVALKVLAAGRIGNEESRSRFLRESRLAASLDHPNVLPIFDAGEDGGVLYLAMRYVEGGDLGARLRSDGRLSAGTAVAIARQVASALTAAHDAQLVHRDVKPGNILLATSEHAYLADFGLARRADSATMTRTGAFLGSVDYCPPEQIEGLPLDGRADIYATGCVLYHCLVGQPPYVRDSEVAVIKAHLFDPLPDLAALRPDLPEALTAAITTALAKAPADRFDTASAFERALADAARRLTPEEPEAAHRRVPAATIVDPVEVDRPPALPSARSRPRLRRAPGSSRREEPASEVAQQPPTGVGGTVLDALPRRDAAPEPVRQGAGRRFRRPRRSYTFAGGAVALCGVAAALVWIFGTTASARVVSYREAGPSMEPTLHCAAAALCLGTRSDVVDVHESAGGIRRGDIVVFEPTAAARARCGTRGMFILRVVGLPGNKVTERRGWMYIDAARLREPYVARTSRVPNENRLIGWTTPPRSYFLLGDNRALACDSRSFGSVPAIRILGKVVRVHHSPALATALIKHDVPHWIDREQLPSAARAGATLFARFGCTSCHTYLGVGSARLGGPDLSAIGSRNRGTAFQIAHLECPPCLVRGSPMPEFAQLGNANLRKLALFLEASKGPKPARTGNPTVGFTLFVKSGCTGCHTLAAANATGTVGPNLDLAKPTLRVVIEFVTQGSGAMPAFKATLSKAQIADIAAFVVKSTTGVTPTASISDAEGETVFKKNQCGACHTLSAAGATGTVGPSLDKLGEEAQRASQTPGTFARESIVDPNAYVEKGFPANVMPPTFATSLSEQRLDALVRYLVRSSRK